MDQQPLNPAFELRFLSLLMEGRGYAFPCDAEGHVELDGLSERARLNYFFARKCVGRRFAAPAVQPTGSLEAAVRLRGLCGRQGAYLPMPQVLMPSTV